MLPRLVLLHRVMRLLAAEAKSEGEIPSAFAGMAAQRASGFVWIADPFLNQQVKQIAELASKYRLPSIGVNQVYAAAGGLMTYGVNPAKARRHLAQYVDKIFKGANPAELPVEQPTKFDLVINRRTAKALGVTFPPDLLVLADTVIE